MTDELNAFRDRQRMELALRAAGLGDFQWDLDREVVILSDRMVEITGLPARAPVGRMGDFLEPHVHAEDRDYLAAQRHAGMATGDMFDFQVRFIRPDNGRMIWLRIAGIVTPRTEAHAGMVTGVVEDVTAAQAEEQKRQLHMAELDHRVKNALAAVQALAQQTAKRTTSVDAFLEAFNGRIRAMGAANELLTAARWRGASIENLVSAIPGALAPGQTQWTGPEVFLTPRAANALSLALHELATNAVKFGALSTEDGHVDIRWTMLPSGGFDLVWSESGGPAVSPPTRTGFGTTLIAQVAGHELNGEAHTEFLPNGARARIMAGPAAITKEVEVEPEPSSARTVDTAASQGGSVNLKGARVLVVEDAVLLALELETALTDAGAIVVGPAYELDEALALLNQPIDAVILDANLNGRSAIPVAEILARRKAPFVFATGYGESGAPGGFDAPVIRKPYDVNQVISAVAQLLESSRVR